MANRKRDLTVPDVAVRAKSFDISRREEAQELLEEGAPVNRDVPTSLGPSSKVMLYIYMFLFFGAMIGHEVALEAASTSFGHLDSLASAATCFQFSFCVFFPTIISKGKGLRALPRTARDVLPYIRLSILVFGATGLATEAVRYVTYPTKVVFKSAKLIPTMAVATVWQGQIYSVLEYVAAILLCAGAAGYSYGSGQGNGSEESSTSAASWGICLLVASILCDAIVPNYQKLLLNQGLSATQLMINVNTVGSFSVLVYMVATGQLADIVKTCGNNPLLLFYLTSVGIGLSTAVWAYTKLIQATSSVVAVAVSTLRKVATIALSYIIFPKPLLPIHIASFFMVVAGMVLSSIAKERSSIKSRDSK